MGGRSWIFLLLFFLFIDWWELVQQPLWLCQKRVRVFWSMLTTQKCLGWEGRIVQESIPCFLPWSTVPASPTLQTAARRVSACDKTCWAPALLSAGTGWGGQEAGLTFQSSQGLPGHSSSLPFALTPFSPKDCHSPRAGCQGMEGDPSSAVRMVVTKIVVAFTLQQVQFGFSDPFLGYSVALWSLFLPPFHISHCGVKLVSPTRIMRRTIPLKLKDPIRHPQHCHPVIIPHFDTFQDLQDIQEGWRGILTRACSDRIRGNGF